MCFFASVQQHATMLESNIGSCQFCKSQGTVDLVEQYKKHFWFGMIPSEANVDRLAVCRQCGKMVKEVYYTLRDGDKEEHVPMVKGEVA
jgi:hypothetical protein